ncbi:MAG: sialate O-acetylesterase, partial [Verrucomicrobiaceae bacterium]
MKKRILIAVLFLTNATVRAGVHVSPLFSNHMVLQRDMPAPVWGTAAAGEKVVVKFRDQTKTADADAAGKWMVKLDPLKTGEPGVLTVAGTNTLTLEDVLVGDVWLCSGQSNMEWTLNSFKADEDIAKADFPKIRHCARGGSWSVCSSKTAGDFTAVGFYFGCRVHQETGVPIGLIHNAIGGTPIEHWMPMVALDTSPFLKELELKKMIEYRERLTKGLPEIEAWIKTAGSATGAGVEFPAQPKIPDLPKNLNYSMLFTPHTLPLIPFAVKGMIWYQGENNNGDDDYDHKMKAFATGIRKSWGQGEFPIYFVQLPNIGGANGNPEGGDGWSKFRAQQARCATIPNGGMVVTIDVGDAGNIHPANKLDVGHRLAQWALAKDYGKKELIPCGPVYKAMKVEGNKVRLTFDFVGKGLMVGAKSG